MNEKIKNHLIRHFGRGREEVSDADIIEELRWTDTIHKKAEGESRWWINVFCVAEIDGMLVGYLDAETTGDRGPDECGFEFDPSSICEVKKVEKTITDYEPI